MLGKGIADGKNKNIFKNLIGKKFLNIKSTVPYGKKD